MNESFVFLGLLLFLYFLPAFVAMVRQHRWEMSLVILNLFLGWTLIGWVAVLLWACISDVAPGALTKNGIPPSNIPTV